MQNPLSQRGPVSRRTFLVAAAAGFIPWTHSGWTHNFSRAWQEDDPWQLTGNAADRYQRYLVPAVFAPWAADLLERAGLQPNDRVLDVACGTGVVTRLAAQRVGEGGTVAGLDFSVDMLAVARALPPAPGPVIDWREGNAMSLPFSSQAFHIVLCQQGLQFFSDGAKALREMHRVLVPDGRVAVSIWHGLSKNPYTAVLFNAIARHLSAGLAEEIREPFAFGEPDELRSLLVTSGFRGITIDDVALEMRVNSLQEFVLGHLSLFSFYAILAAKELGERRLLIDEVLRELKAYTRGAELRVPWRAMVGMAAK